MRNQFNNVLSKDTHATLDDKPAQRYLRRMFNQFTAISHAQ